MACRGRRCSGRWWPGARLSWSSPSRSGCWGWTRPGSGDHRPLACPRPGAALEKLAADRGITISQLAIAWTLANPAVDVAIVGARQARHVEDSLAAADITLSTADLTDIDTIMATAVTTTAVTTTAVTTAAVAAGRPDRTGGVVQRRRTR